MFKWILLGIIVLVVLIYMGLGFYLHHALFGKRFTKDPIVKYYSVDMFEGLKYESDYTEVDTGITEKIEINMVAFAGNIEFPSTFTGYVPYDPSVHGSLLG